LAKTESYESPQYEILSKPSKLPSVLGPDIPLSLLYFHPFWVQIFSSAFYTSIRSGSRYSPQPSILPSFLGPDILLSALFSNSSYMFFV
jgi:hypothetical protein